MTTTGAVTTSKQLKSILHTLSSPRRVPLSSAKGALLALGGGALLAGQCLAADAGTDDRASMRPVTVEHIRISSKRSYDEVRSALESRIRPFRIERVMPFVMQGDMAGARAELEQLAAPTGLSILYSLDHGLALSLEGAPRKAVGYGIGNVLIAASMNQHNLAAGLYAPIRVVLYEGADGTALFEYDRPSSMFGQFGDAAIDSVAAQLDVTLKNLLLEVSK
ncbi:DUF302 domain-containing protein [Rugamonas apoptosis]|uniref:DUF302 domain-containing protein n=1 Tax=Rugamonas apoptosis TaxID=2758570 RepID=A0A7W2FBZ2_9BURK|nr:DUF302 domain-containing protein [Rugamonas apoptosis]MBA5688916.1 DUF302 domain-containing protein [Rugamonas apoptosis]